MVGRVGRFTKIKNLHCKIKNEVIERILSNQDLLKYIYYASSNPLGENDIDDTVSLINTYVFKRSKALNTETDAQNYLFVKINSPTDNTGGILKEIYVVMDVICHNSLVDNLSDGSDRSLVIMDYLDEMFDDAHSQYWMGGMQYVPFRELGIDSNYSGYRLCYKVTI